MPQTDVKTTDQHFRMHTSFRDGKVVANVWDFSVNQSVLEEACDDVEEAKKKCEEYAKGRIENCPAIQWKNFQQAQVSVIT